MIFVTVGTHEQQFNRLIKEMDELVKNKELQEEVIIQTGFSSFEPQYCTWKKMFSYEEMCRHTELARIVITHGGPSSFIMALQLGKVPIVVPRRKKYGEHVNDHQLDFGMKLKERQGNILLITDINDLKNTILHYDNLSSAIHKAYESSNEKFCRKLEMLVAELYS